MAAPTAGDTDDVIARTIGAYQGSAVDAPFAPPGMANIRVSGATSTTAATQVQPHRPTFTKETVRVPCGSGEESSARAQRQLGAAPQDGMGPDPGSKTACSGRLVY